MNCSWDFRNGAGRVCGRYSLLMDTQGRKRRAFGVIFPNDAGETVTMYDDLRDFRRALNERAGQVSMSKIEIVEE